MASNTSSAFHPARMTGLCVCGGDLHGDSDHPTVLDCPAGVVECSCGGNAVNACRCGTPEPVLASPSYGATVTSVVQASSCYLWTRGGVVCVAAVGVVARCLVWWMGVVMLLPALFFVHNVHHRPVNSVKGGWARCSNFNFHFHLIVPGATTFWQADLRRNAGHEDHSADFGWLRN